MQRVMYGSSLGFIKNIGSKVQRKLAAIYVCHNEQSLKVMMLLVDKCSNSANPVNLHFEKITALD